MKTNKSLLIIAVILFPLLLKSQNSKQLVSHETLSQIIESSMEEEHISGLSACIVKGNETIWQQNFGLANRETNNAVNDSTTFLLYSITKTFTGIGLMQLNQVDSFNLDDPINDYLPFEILHPDYPNTDITFKMLMCHISGIVDNWAVINSLMVYNEDTEIGLEEFVQEYLLPEGSYYSSNGSFSNNQPGTTFDYSNVGATLAGYLIETISGQPYHQYIEKKILLPLGMDKSKFYLSEMDTSNLAVQYSYGGGQYNAVGFMSCPLLPAGFLHSTRDEMANYLKMLINRGSFDGVQIIDSSLFENMITEQFPSIAPNSGLFFSYDNINNLWGHYGGSSGVKTLVLFDKEEDWGVVLLSNGAGLPFDIASILFQYAREHKSVSLTEIELEDANNNLIIENSEFVELNIKVKNELLKDLSDVTALISCNTPNMVIFNDSIAIIPDIYAGEEFSVPIQFSFTTQNFNSTQEVEFLIHYTENQHIFDSCTFKLHFGDADILLIKDEEHLFSNVANTVDYYKTSIEAADLSCRVFDINLFKVPNYTFLENFNATVWFTGLDNEAFHSILCNEEKHLITDYLNNGGKLLICGQNISDAVGTSNFFNYFLHATETTPYWEGPLAAQGIEGNAIGDGLTFNITGGEGNSNTYSPSAIEPFNGGEKIFCYSTSDEGAGIMFDGNYKLVFLPFCMAAIDNHDKRNELMRRILTFLNPELSVKAPTQDNNIIKIFPNPSNGEQININSSASIIDFEIYSIKGKKINCKRLFSDNSIIIEDLRPGIYIIHLTTCNSVTTKKIIVN